MALLALQPPQKRQRRLAHEPVAVQQLARVHAQNVDRVERLATREGDVNLRERSERIQDTPKVSNGKLPSVQDVNKITRSVSLRACLRFRKVAVEVHCDAQERHALCQVNADGGAPLERQLELARRELARREPVHPPLALSHKV